ncbi:MAG: FAD-dependent oxidoreductase [Desulfobacterales bacterium]|jgi:mycofactocin system FadH/OYE family oxidoreductase 2
MTAAFKFLFAPIQLGNVLVPNRIVSTAHATGYARDGIPAERLIAYHEARAKGGVGLIITGATVVHPTSPYDEYNLLCNVDDRIIPAYQQMARAVQKYGSRIMAQLSHMGRSGETDDSRYPLYGPSPIADEIRREPPAAMDVELIEEIIEAYGKAAARAREGGLDGVEIHGGHSSLVAQFMSPYANQRTDAYGGSRKKRLEFVMRVSRAIRKNVGEDFTVGLRLSGDEFVDGGLTLDVVKENARDLEATGMLDFIDVTAGTDSNMHSYYIHYSPMFVPMGNLTHLSAAIKEAVSLPVITVGRINDPVMAEKILADGLADLVGMTRAALCDPDFPRKAREGRLDDIRHCIACNQGCFKRIFKAQPITCIQNPAAGKERELGPLHKATVARKVVVVGGGPAGLETARIAAERGHQVVLLEKDTSLGGQIRLASQAPGRQEFGEVILYLSRQVEKAGVDTRLGVEGNVEKILGLTPDAVVIAAGARPEIPDIAGAQSARGVTAWDILGGKVPDGRSFVVIDGDKEDQVAVGTAEYLADLGKAVEIISRLPYVGKDLDILNFVPIYQRLLEKGVRLTPHSGIAEIRNQHIVLYNVYTGAQESRRDVDVVVFAAGRVAEDRLYWDLKSKIGTLYRIGDCLAPRSVLSAISEGNRVGRTI